MCIRDSFLGRICRLRDEELLAFRQYFNSRIMNIFMNYLNGPFVICVAFSTYVLLGFRLTAEEALTLVSTYTCLLYTSPSPRDGLLSRMPSSA
eukprot:TRINITY_DN12171_c0_g1_i2.p1 TRINITY_DN12171_c0_g1~~TRINITY_DN12171_c0_g1_i2.p1  ORF type:complete len:103 (+),score=23.69 TRINITY_DN12171_c0_g1_i2:32-310(+)